jgi:glucose/arabinose dehydrogenase
MRRLRNLTAFALAATVVLVVGGLLLRGPVLRALGVNPDLGPGGRADLIVPDGYAASVYASGLAGPRFMAVSPDGVLFVAERGADRVVALPDHDGDGVADETIVVGEGYDRAHDIEFEASGALLISGESILHRITLDDSGLREVGRETVVDGLPGGGRHAAKTVEVLPSGDLLMSMGSSCDVCIEADPRRGAISLIDPASGDQRIYMTGLRNAVGLWVDDETGRAWATVMGRDLFGDDRPPETLYEVTDGADGGWPRCHAGSIPDPEFGRDADACTGVAQPAATFQAHSAPLALVGWRDRLVIAFHGSWNRSAKVGYNVVWLPWDRAPAGEASELASGFLAPGSDSALGRPAGLAVGADGALYVSDDKAGFIYRVAAYE